MAMSEQQFEKLSAIIDGESDVDDKLLRDIDANAELRARWQQEKALIQEIHQAKEQIETLRIEAENLERQVAYDKVAYYRDSIAIAAGRKGLSEMIFEVIPTFPRTRNYRSE